MPMRNSRGRFTSGGGGGGAGGSLGGMGVVLTANNMGLRTGLAQSITMLNSASAQFAHYGKRMSLAVTAPLTLMGRSAVKAFGEFDDALTKSLAIMGDSGARLRGEMSSLAVDLSRTLPMSATKAAESYFFLASAGLSAEQSMASLPAVMKFAVAGAFDMARATDLVTDAQSALGMSSKDTATHLRNMNRLTDVLTKANILANASIEQFSVSLTTKSGTALKLLNKDVEEGVAVLAAFADQGIKAESGGEALNMVLRDLQRASLKNAQEWSKMGLVIYDTTGKMLPLVEIISQLENKFLSMSDKQKRVSLMMLGFQDRSVAATAALLGTSEKIREYEAALRSAGGTVEDVVNRQMESFSAQMSVVKNKVTALAIEVGAVLAPYMRTIGNYVEKATEAWKAYSDATKKQIVLAGALAAALGPTLMILGLMASSLGAIVTAFMKIGGMLKVFSGVALVIPALRMIGGLVAAMSLGPWIAGFVGVIAVVNILLSVFKSENGLMGIWDKIKTKSMAFFKAIPGFFANFRQNMSTIMGWLSDNWGNMFRDMGNIVVLFFKNMAYNNAVAAKTLIKMFMFVQGYIANLFLQLFTTDFWTALFKGLQGAINAIWDWAANISSWIWDAIMGVDVSSAVNKTKENLKKILLDPMKDGVNSVDFFGDLVKIAKEGFDEMRSPLEGFKSSLESMPKLNLSVGVEGIEIARKSITDTVQQVGASTTQAIVQASGGSQQRGYRGIKNAWKGKQFVDSLRSYPVAWANGGQGRYYDNLQYGRGGGLGSGNSRRGIGSNIRGEQGMTLPPQFSMDVLPAVQEAEKKFQAAEQTVKMWETLAPQFQAMGGPMLAGASQQAMEALKTRDEAFMELQKVQASGLAFGAVQQIGFGQGVSIDTTTGLPGEGVDGELGGEEQKTPLEKLALQTNMLLERVELNTRVPVARVRGGMS